MVEPQKCYKITYGAIAAYQEVNGKEAIYYSETRIVDVRERPIDVPAKVLDEVIRRFRFVFGHPINQRDAAIAKVEDIEVWA